MSGNATTFSPNTTLRAGFVGAILGGIAALSIVFGLGAFATQSDRTLDLRAESGPAAVTDLGSALRAHQAREYGSVSGVSPALDMWAALRAHQAREYGSVSGVSPALDMWAALRAHQAREYRGQ